MGNGSNNNEEVEMKVVNAKQLEAVIEASVKGTTAVSVVAETKARMVKKHRETGEANPFLGAIKRQKKNGLIGFDYQNAVNNQAEREDKAEREAKSRAWGVLSESRLFVHHKGASYLQLKLQSTTDTVYLLNGVEIAEADIKPYLSASRKSSTQEDLDKAVIINDIKLENIKALTMMGETYVLSHSVSEQEKESNEAVKEIA
jgi:hypothetical protein